MRSKSTAGLYASASAEPYQWSDSENNDVLARQFYSNRLATYYPLLAQLSINKLLHGNCKKSSHAVYLPTRARNTGYRPTYIIGVYFHPTHIHHYNKPVHDHEYSSKFESVDLIEWTSHI